MSSVKRFVLIASFVGVTAVRLGAEEFAKVHEDPASEIGKVTKSRTEAGGETDMIVPPSTTRTQVVQKSRSWVGGVVATVLASACVATSGGLAAYSSAYYGAKHGAEEGYRMSSPLGAAEGFRPDRTDITSLVMSPAVGVRPDHMSTDTTSLVTNSGSVGNPWAVTVAPKDVPSCANMKDLAAKPLDNAALPPPSEVFDAVKHVDRFAMFQRKLLKVLPRALINVFNGPESEWETQVDEIRTLLEQYNDVGPQPGNQMAWLKKVQEDSNKFISNIENTMRIFFIDVKKWLQNGESNKEFEEELEKVMKVAQNRMDKHVKVFYWANARTIVGDVFDHIEVGKTTFGYERRRTMAPLCFVGPPRPSGAIELIPDGIHQWLHCRLSFHANCGSDLKQDSDKCIDFSRIFDAAAKDFSPRLSKIYEISQQPFLSQPRAIAKNDHTD